MNVTPKGENQAARWNGRPGHAWVEAQEMLDRMYQPFEDLLVESVVAGSRGTVLDVGCGTGSTTVGVARRLGAGGQSIGIDISEPMIAAARARAERERTSARFICANAQTLPLEPASLDSVISRFGVMFFDDPVLAFSNLRRAAADGAGLRFVAWRSPEANPFMTAAERAAAPLLPNLPPRIPDAPGQFGFANAERVRGILESSGWDGIDIRPIDVECRFPEQALVPYLTRFGPVGLVLHEADDATRAAVIHAAREACNPFVNGADVRFIAACWLVGARC